MNLSFYEFKNILPYLDINNVCKCNTLNYNYKQNINNYLIKRIKYELYNIKNKLTKIEGLYYNNYNINLENYNIYKNLVYKYLKYLHKNNNIILNIIEDIKELKLYNIIILLKYIDFFIDKPKIKEFCLFRLDLIKEKALFQLKNLIINRNLIPKYTINIVEKYVNIYNNYNYPKLLSKNVYVLPNQVHGWYLIINFINKHTKLRYFNI